MEVVVEVLVELVVMVVVVVVVLVVVVVVVVAWWWWWWWLGVFCMRCTSLHLSSQSSILNLHLTAPQCTSVLSSLLEVCLNTLLMYSSSSQHSRTVSIF